MRQPISEQRIHVLLGMVRGHLRDGYRIHEAVEFVRRQCEDLGISDYDADFGIAVDRLTSDLDAVRDNETGSLHGPDHIDWYAGPGPDDLRWSALRNYLENRQPDESIVALDRLSTQIVASINPPGGSRTTRGLVLGYIQSGKTASMTAVIAKAADAGFRMVLILTGMTDLLRNQTQQRLIDDLQIATHQDHWHRLTDTGADFHRPPGGTFPQTRQVMLAVLKKNTSPLRQFLSTVRDTADVMIESLPVLVIDDECDQASINTRRDDVTAINRLIRDILGALPRSHYIGYTATPFANVLINPGVSEDLYPRDFIVALPRPGAYFGAEELFAQTDPEGPDERPDMIRYIPAEDVHLMRPDDIRNLTERVTGSLETALHYFLLATAARRVRGSVTERSSMLVHTSHLQQAHFRTQSIIEIWKDETRRCLENNDEDLFDLLEPLWNEEAERVDSERWGFRQIPFNELAPFLAEIISDLPVIVENSASADRLDYDRDLRQFILIGGNVLSRGLTVDGLVTTYFLRPSNQYDTLMQTARWFGYRPGYEDLPRIWMEAVLAQNFGELSEIEQEIRQEIDRYAARRVTPADLAVRIRQLPAMMVTARNKMLHAVRCTISFRGAHRQTRKFKERDVRWLRSNLQSAETLVQNAVSEGIRLEGAPMNRAARVLRSVPVSMIRRFLGSYRVHEDHPDMQTDLIIGYIDRVVENSGHLREWNVALMEPRQGESSLHDLGTGSPIRFTRRSRTADSVERDADIQALMSKRDLIVDLTGNFENADSWYDLKSARERTSPDQPLLLLYLLDRNSTPLPGHSRRRPLGAVEDVLAMGIVFPGVNESGEGNYISVDLPDLELPEVEQPEHQIG